MRILYFLTICIWGIVMPHFVFAEQDVKQELTEEQRQEYLQALEQIQENQTNSQPNTESNQQQIPSTFQNQASQRSPQQQNSAEQSEQSEKFDLEAELGAGKDIEDFMIDNPNEPETQQEINTLIDNYLKAQFGDVVYTESTSIGEIKMMIRQPVLHTNEMIQFIIIPQHIDESLDFEKADYTWNVRKGDEILKTVQDQGKLMFYFDFYEPGTYQVEAEVEFEDGTKKSSLMTFDVYDPLELSFTPETPGKGDPITVQADHNFSSDTRFQWTVDGKVVEEKKDEITFQEFKGYGREYNVEVKATGKDGSLQSLGKKIISIKAPKIDLSVIDMKREEPINFISQTRIDEPTSVRIRPKMFHFPEDAHLNYYYRVNGEIVHKDEVFTFEVDPQQQYEVDLVVVDELSEVSARQTFTINPEQRKDSDVALAAQMSDMEKSSYSSDPIPGRYINLGLLGAILLLSFFLSRYGKIK